MSLNRKRISTFSTSSNSTTSLNRLSLHMPKKTFSTNSNTTKTKPSWDSTNSDLKQMKLTSDELERRKQLSVSKNADLVKFEKQQQLMTLNAKKNKDAKLQLALLKEILYDDEQLKSLIHNTDSTLKTVKDFFQLDNQQNTNNNHLKKQAKINMTLAPNVTDLNESNLPYNISSCNANTMKMNKKQTILTTAKCTNANSLDSNEEENDLNKSDLIDLQLKKAKLSNDIESYRQLLEIKKDLINQKLNDNPIIVSKKSNELDECINLLSNATNATNTDTDKINKLKHLIKSYATNIEQQHQQLEDHHKEHDNVNKSLMSNLNDEFKRNLTDLENKIIEFEKDTGKQLFNKYSTGNLTTQSTCTQTLIRIVSVLIDYLKHVYNDLNYEKLVHAETSKQLDIHRRLIDGLTNEILSVKEQNEKILKNYSNQQAKFEHELDQIKETLFHQNQQNRQIEQQQPPPPPHIVATRPIAFKSHDLINSRPISCNSDKLNDKFTERLNAMLQSESTLANHNHNNYRPSSTGLFSSANTSQIKSLNDFNYDFNQQFHELTTKSMQANQKFKHLQLDHNLHSVEQQHQHQNNNTRDNSRDTALEKLKQEQDLIKEQINILNKQRESAQIELEVLSLTSSSNNLPKTSNSHHNSNNINKRSNNTPSLSPISLSDNIYSDGKSSSLQINPELLNSNKNRT